MKKILFVSIVAFFSVLSVLAVPSGTYTSTERVRNNVLVDNSGKTLYVLAKDGTVLAEWTVIEETKEDGGTSFVLKSKFGVIVKNNGWWIEDGKVYMNLRFHGSVITLVKD